MFAGVVTALSDRLVGGPFPARLLSFNPARPRLLDWPVTLPPSRGGDRYILGYAPDFAGDAQQLHPALFPVKVFCSLAFPDGSPSSVA